MIREFSAVFGDAGHTDKGTEISSIEGGSFVGLLQLRGLSYYGIATTLEPLLQTKSYHEARGLPGRYAYLRSH